MKKILAALLLTTTILVPQAAQAKASSVEIVAHKTGPLDAPENTHQGITVAKSKNASLTWVEVDIRWSKSNFPHLMHNATVDATTNYSGNLRDYWFTNVMQMNAADYSPWNKKNANGSWVYPQYQGSVTDSAGKVTAKVHPSYAYEFFNAAKAANVNLLLDVKDVPNKADADKLMEYINRASYGNRVIYMSSPTGVKTMKGFYPQLKYIIGEYPATDVVRTIESIKANGATGYGMPYYRITKTLVDYYHSGGIQVFTWTSDSVQVDVASNWTKVVNDGVDFLITNQHAAAENLLP